jgi:hypothetical protein
MPPKGRLEQPHSSVRPEGPGDDTAPVKPEPKSRTGAMKTARRSKATPAPKPAPRPKRRR